MYSFLISKILFFPLIFTFHSGNLQKCDKNEENSCNVGFECTEHQSYKQNVCKPYQNAQLSSLTPLLIEGYGQSLNIDQNMIKLFKMMAHRESNGQWWAHHWMPGDVDSIPKSMSMSNMTYDIEFRPNMYKKCLKTQHTRLENANDECIELLRWQGYGLFGQNSVFFTKFLGSSEPELLMHPYFALKAYSINAERVAKKLRAGVACDGKNFTGSIRNKPSIADIHNAVSGGSLCPRNKNDSREVRFRKSAPYAFTTLYTSPG